MNLLSFVAHTVSVVTTQFCLCGVKAAIDKATIGHDYMPIKFYFQEQGVGQTWPPGS